MSDAATLITAITALVTASTGLIGAVVVLIKILRSEPEQAARKGAIKGAEKTGKLIKDAARDGKLTAREVEKIMRSVTDGDEQDPDENEEGRGDDD